MISKNCSRELLQEVCRGSIGCSTGRAERGFLRVDGGKTVGNWTWRLDKDDKGSRTWHKRLRSDLIWFKDGGSNDAKECRN